MKKNFLLYVFSLFFLTSPLFSGEKDTNQNISSTADSMIIKVIFIAKDGASLTAIFDNASDIVKIMMANEKPFTLPRALSASGARYADIGEKTVFWIKGEDASLWINDQLIFTGTAKEN